MVEKGVGIQVTAWAMQHVLFDEKTGGTVQLAVYVMVHVITNLDMEVIVVRH